MNAQEHDGAPPPALLFSKSGSTWLEFRVLMGGLMIVGLLPSWIGLAGGLHWVFDLCSHFRWQYLAVCVVAVIWAAWKRHRLVLLVSGATLLLNGWMIGQMAWNPEVSREGVAGDFKLRVLSMNVLTSNHDSRSVKREIEASEAEVVFLMEVNHRWTAALSELRALYPHHVALPREDNFGVALFSKIPWTRQEILWLGQAHVPSIEIELSHQGRPLTIIGTHPLPPVGGTYSRARNEQLESLAEHVMEAGTPVLVVGDLNATPWSAGMRLLMSTGHLRFRSLYPPWAPTWRVGSVFAIPIDHALCTPPLVITDRTIGPDVGSDHRPLLVDVGWERRVSKESPQDGAK